VAFILVIYNLEVAPDTDQGFFIMKKMLYRIVVAGLAIGLLFVSGSYGAAIRIKGNGKSATSEKKVGAFEKINASSSAEVRFHSGSEYRAVVTVDENLLEYVVVETKNNALNLGVKSGNSYTFTKFIIDVYGRELKGVTMSGSGSFGCEDKIAASDFEANVSGSGKITGKIACDNFNSRISGSGKITIEGDAKDASVIISGSGDFLGYGFSVKDASVNISGSGKMEISVEENLKAAISGSGGINYRGEPKSVETKVTGSGRVRKM
jgi:hypothetical protein